MTFHELEYRLKHSALPVVFRRVAPLLFEEWSRNAAIEYNLPKEQFNIDGNDLPLQLREVFLSAADSLTTNPGIAEKKAIRGWSFGYLCGCIEGHLETRWSFDFLARNTDEFKRILSLKALCDFLRCDQITRMRIDLLRRCYLKTMTRNAMVTPRTTDEVKQDVIRLDDYRKSAQSETAADGNDLIEFLESEIETRTHSLLKKYSLRLCPSIVPHLNVADVIEVVGAEQFTE